MSLTADQINKLCEHLQGTCEDIDENLQSMFDLELTDLSDEELELIDDKIFQCTVCSWWYEIAEQEGDSEDPVCRDCADDPTI